MQLLIWSAKCVGWFLWWGWLDLGWTLPGSFQINSAQFLFVFGPTHLLSLFWSLFAGLPSDPARFNEATIESETTKLATVHCCTIFLCCLEIYIVQPLGTTSDFFGRFFSSPQTSGRAYSTVQDEHLIWQTHL